MNATHDDITDQLDAREVEPFTAWADDQGLDYVFGEPNIVEMFRDAYQGEYESLADYAQDLSGDVVTHTDMSRWPFSCIDWEHAGRELEMGGDIWTAQVAHNRLFVFRTV